MPSPALAESTAERVGHAEFVTDDVALDGRPVDAHGTVLKVDHARADGEGGVQGGRGLFDGGNGRLGNDLRNGLFLRTGRFAHVARCGLPETVCGTDLPAGGTASDETRWARIIGTD